MGLRDLFKPRADRPSEPSARKDPDKAVLKELRKIGANLSKPREVIHFLYFPTQVAAEKAATHLRGEGYAIDVRPAADAGENPPNPWLMEARIHAVVDETTVAPMRAKFESLAEAGSGEYDGWEAATD
jgi:Regulator of ribonuclease activity B